MNNDIGVWEIISSVGTLLAALATLFTIVEMKIQRRESYKPRIIIPNHSAMITLTSSKIVPIDENITFAVENVGFGPCLDLTISFTYDFSFISKILKQNNMPAIIEKDKFICDVYNAINIEHNSSVYLECLKSTDKAVNINCPFYLFPVLSSVIYSFKKTKKDISALHLPELQVKISFTDISGKHYTVKKNITFELAVTDGLANDEKGATKGWSCCIVYKI